MLLESRGYIGTRDELVTEYPTRVTVEVEWPDRKNIREQWPIDSDIRYINTIAPESGMILYNHADLQSRYKAEMLDILRNQSYPSPEVRQFLMTVYKTQWGFDQSIYLFNFGLLSGKRIEKKRLNDQEVDPENQNAPFYDLLNDLPSRTTIEVEWPDRMDIREQWIDEGNLHLVNTVASDDGMIQYHHNGYMLTLELVSEAAMIDTLRNQPVPTSEEQDMLRAIRGTSSGVFQAIHLYNYGVMVGKHIERKRRQMEARKHENTD